MGWKTCHHKALIAMLSKDRSMYNNPSSLDRRSFLTTLALTAAGLTAGLPAKGQPTARRKIKLGYDNYSIRALGLKAPALLDYAVELKLDSVFITDLGALESFEDKYLADLKSRATDRGIDIYLGGGSICPTSAAFTTRYGTAEELLALGIRLAKALGSPVFRAVLGNGRDRRGPGGIDARIAETVKVLKTARARALDAGVKIAIENHAGDMQGWELVSLVEAAGKDFIGITFDSGNAVSALEDPLSALEVMAPYVAATHLRDIMVWEYEDGAMVQWCAVGDGLLDWPRFINRLAQWCPGVSVHFEIISGSNTPVPYLKPEFWEVWPKMRAADFAKFLALAKRGKLREPHLWPSDRQERLEAEREYQRSELERSVKYAREVLRLGVRAG
jgi:sugar phosphate isomerase/epimerase